MASTRKAVSGNVQRLKNAATIFGITQTPSSNVTNSLSIRTSAVTNDSRAGYPIVSTVQGRKKALSSGGFAYFLANHYVVLSGNITVQLAGVSNTVMATASSFARRAIAYKLTARTSFLQALSWSSVNSISGPAFVLTKTSQTINVNMGGTGTDTEAALSPTVRGNLVFMAGKLVPTSTNYKNLYLW